MLTDGTPERVDTLLKIYSQEAGLVQKKLLAGGTAERDLLRGLV